MTAIMPSGPVAMMTLAFGHCAPEYGNHGRIGRGICKSIRGARMSRRPLAVFITARAKFIPEAVR